MIVSCESLTIYRLAAAGYNTPRTKDYHVKALDRQTLSRLWSAVPTPWKQDGSIDEGILHRNCAKLKAAGVDGIYTTDSDGEFYAIELNEFRHLAGVFGKAMESAGIDAAMGVTWSHTQGIVDRIKAACDAGIPNVHVAFPIFMPLAKGDVDRFWDDLATAVPQARWIHYAHPRCGPTLSGADYRRLALRHPDQFIGSKLGTTDLMQLSEILVGSPELAHFVVDPTMGVGMMLGARGCYSYWVNTLPGWHRRYMDSCVRQDWVTAATYHRKLIEWELKHVRPLRDLGHLHGIIGKARGALTGFLEDTGRTRPPYYPIAPELKQAFQSAFDTYWAEEIRHEQW